MTAVVGYWHFWAGHKMDLVATFFLPAPVLLCGFNRSIGRAWRAACAVNFILDYPVKPGNDGEERPEDGRGVQGA